MSGIVLFDGDCTFCNRSVQFIFKRDPKAFFQFAPLNSTIGTKLKQKHHIPSDIDSLILIENNRWYAKSTAALRISKQLNGFWKCAFLLIIIPKPVRDFIYDLIAKNRNRLFQNKACPLPSPELRKRFLQ